MLARADADDLHAVLEAVVPALFQIEIFTIFSSVFQDVAHFFAQDSAKFRKNPQNSEILSNSLAFREIPEKIYDISTENMRN